MMYIFLPRAIAIAFALCLMFPIHTAYAQTTMYPYSSGSHNLTAENYNSETYSREVVGIRNPDAAIRGSVVFELTKQSQGSGRIFGQAAGVPYTKVELYKDDNTRISPEPGWFSQHNFSDEIGQFSWNKPFPNWAPANGDQVTVRMYGESRTAGSEKTRITYGPSFSPFERTCRNSSGNICNSEERWEDLTESYLQNVIDCMEHGAENDVINSDVPEST